MAWLLIIGAIGASAFFIVLYSMSWGKQKSEEWLMSFIMSIIESFTFIDPLTVGINCVFYTTMHKIKYISYFNVSEKPFWLHIH